jgi:hypothetical protein
MYVFLRLMTTLSVDLYYLELFLCSIKEVYHDIPSLLSTIWREYGRSSTGE